MDLRDNKALTPVESGFPIISATIDLTKRCNLGCDYCNVAGTPILMADLTHKAIEDVKTGDEVIGFVIPDEQYEHTYFTVSTVEAKMERETDIVEVVTTHGSFRCTPDHRWFNGRNYVPPRIGGKIKYVSDPVLFKETNDYKIGYIHGMMVGDGTFSEGIHVMKSGSRKGQKIRYHHVRLALNDNEPLDRIERYLIELEWPAMNRFTFTEKMQGLRTSKLELFNKLQDWPDKQSSVDYIKGWAAGIFDAEGNYDGNSLRISQLEGKTLDAIIYSLEFLGFDITYESYQERNNVKSIRIKNGYSDVVKFFATCNPAITRKKKKVLIDKTVYGNSEILDIVPVGYGKVYSMQTSTHNYIAHGHMSKNCFSHCFNKDRELSDLSPETGKKIIDWLMLKSTHGDQKEVDISFWGGEPLLKWELLKELVLYAEEKAKEAGVKVKFGGTTNVTLLTPDKFDFLEEHNIYFLLSIDGTEEHHDKHRKFVNGRGSWDVVDKNATEILKRWPFMQVRFSYSVENLDGIIEDLDYLYNKGFHDIVYSPVSEGDWTEERLEKLKEMWDDIADWYIDKKRTGKPVRLKFLEDACKNLNGQVKGNSAPCGAGRGYVGIDIHGTIRPCHRFNKFDDFRPWYEQETCLGHIDYGILNQEWREKFTKWDPDKDMPESCKSCKTFKESCTGGCWATNWDLNGDISKVPRMNCVAQFATLDQAKKVADTLGPGYVRSIVGPMGNVLPKVQGCECYNVHDNLFGRGTMDNTDPYSCLCNMSTYGTKPAAIKSCDCYNVQDGSRKIYDGSGARCKSYQGENPVDLAIKYLKSMEAELDKLTENELKTIEEFDRCRSSAEAKEKELKTLEEIRKTLEK